MCHFLQGDLRRGRLCKSNEFDSIFWILFLIYNLSYILTLIPDSRTHHPPLNPVGLRTCFFYNHILPQIPVISPNRGTRAIHYQRNPVTSSSFIPVFAEIDTSHIEFKRSADVGHEQRR